MSEAVEITIRPEDLCYSRLLEGIKCGTLQPNERLIEIDLAKSIGVGRAAVRTALARLEQEGLVDRRPYHGAHVRLVGENEAVEILETRAALEGLAARLAALNATADDVQDLNSLVDYMKECQRAGDLLEYSEGNARLHQRILDIANHGTVARLLQTLHAQTVRFQYRTVLFPGRASQSLSEHRMLVEAIASGDPDRAQAMMWTHLSKVAEALRKRVGSREVELPREPV